jgi:hypothetical protein
VHDDRVQAEDRHVHGARAVHARPRRRDLLKQQRRLGDAAAVAAVFLRDRDAEPAGGGEGLVELGRELVRRVPFHPVLVVEPGGQLTDRLADRLLVLGQIEVHASRASFPLFGLKISKD